MNILIIEDEKPASSRLSKMLLATARDIQILGVLESIAASEAWFASNPMPDVVLLDIHLADGSAFDLLQACFYHSAAHFHNGIRPICNAGIQD